MPLVVMSGAEPGGQWLDSSDLAACAPSGVDVEQVAAAAAEMMFALSGHQFGEVIETVRPFQVSDTCGCAGHADIPGYSFSWTSHSAWSRAAACACGGPSYLRLLGPVSDVAEVLVDGEPLVEGDDWTLYDGIWLVRVGGTWPCFPAGTMVLTSTGLRPIEDIRAGEQVLTHRNRWRTVTRAGKTGESETVTVVGRGGSLRCTPDHRLWAAEVVGRPGDRKMGAPEWREAEGMVGYAWAMPREVEALAVPLPDGMTAVPDGLWWMVGRWLGDGWVDAGNNRVVICAGPHEADLLGERLVGEWRRSEDRTTTRFRRSDPALRSWLVDNFGEKAHGKRIPAWMLGAPRAVREEFLAGYVSADGWRKNATDTRTATISVHTVSRDLALGLKMLVASLGLAPLMYEGVQASSVIEGRDVATRTPYRVDWPETPPGAPYSQAWADDDHIWGRVRSVALDEDVVPVYDLEVDEDHSFTADGFVVHNCCQDLTKPSSEPGTWAITYTHGNPVPAAGQLAAQMFACDLAKAAAGEDCALTGRVQLVTRDGVSAQVVILDGAAMLAEGRTGIQVVDLWIASLGVLRGGTIGRPGHPMAGLRVPTLPA